ncbi:MAG: TolC family protein [Negativicutes bacterium]|nr:TolC family protein [Negativicutes bacterium]
MAERHTWKKRLAAVVAGGIFLANSACVLAAPVELSLDDSIALTLKNNPTIKIAEAGKQKSLWGIDQAEAGKGFVLNYNHVDKRYDTPPSPNGSSTYTYTNLFNNQLSLSLPIYTGGKLEGLIDQAKLSYKVSDLNVDATKQQLKLNATTYYFNVLATRNLLDVAKQQVDDFAAHLKNVQAQYDVGTVARSDVLQTQVQLANAQDSLLKAENNYNLAVANLNNVAGLPLSTDLRLKENLKYQQYPLTLDDSVKYALTNRPEIYQAQANVSIAKDQIKVAQSGSLPTLSFAGTNGWYDTDFPGAKNSNWMVSLNLGLNVFDSGLTRSQVKQAEYGMTSAQETARQTKDNIALEVRNAFLSMKEAEKRIDTSKVAVDQAEENFRIAEVRYTAGVGTNLDVVDAELALTQAKTNYIQALYDYNTGKALLDKAMGITVK